MKKVIALILAVLLLVSPTFVSAAKTKKTAKKEETKEVIEEKIEFKEQARVYLFRRDGCGFCEKALAYFDTIKDKYDFKLVTYEVASNQENHDLMEAVAKKLDEKVDGVPYIVIGKTTFLGYTEEYNEGIEKAIIEEGTNGNKNDVVKVVIKEQKKKKQTVTIILSVLVVAGVVALIILGRKSAKENQQK